LRVWLKTQQVAPSAAGNALRERIKACELEAEAIQQALLTATIAVPEGSGEAAVSAGNLARYFGVLGIAPDTNDTAALAEVLRGCHPELPPLDAIRLLSS